MLRTNFYINGNKIKEPLNYKELSIELNFDQDDPNFRGQVSTNQWELGLGSNKEDDGANIIKNYINGGIIGGYGVLEGLEFNIELENNGEFERIFNGYLDIAQASVLCDKVIASSSESGRIDWLNDVADSFTFEYLYNLEGGLFVKGRIKDSDFVPVPYLLTSIPDIYTAAITGMTLYTVLNKFTETIGSLVEKIPQAFIGIGEIVSFFLVLIQLFLLIIASIILVIQLYRLLVPKVKYHAGMYVFTLCQKAAEYLDLDFKSTILESDPFSKLLIMPETFNQFEPIDNNKDRFIQFSKSLIGVQDLLDFDRVGFYRGTFGDLLRELKNMFNAKIILNDNELRLERIDYISNQSSYTLPKIDKSNIPYRFNYEDFYSYYNLSFTLDLNDSNVVQNYQGNELQILTTPKSINKRKNLLGGNKKEIKLGFARGIRRTKKNFIEKMFADVFDNMESIINNIQRIATQKTIILDAIKIKLKKIKKVLDNLGVKFDNEQPPRATNLDISDYINDLRDLLFRKSNVLLLQHDAVGVPKMLLMESDYYNWQNEAFIKLDTRNDLIVNSLYLYNNYHNINTFVGNNHNQYKIYEIDEIPFCYDDYLKVKNNNIIFDSDGVTKGEVINLKWNIYNQTASIKYKSREKYTDNLQEIILFSDGR